MALVIYYKINLIDLWLRIGLKEGIKEISHARECFCKLQEGSQDGP